MGGRSENFVLFLKIGFISANSEEPDCTVCAVSRIKRVNFFLASCNLLSGDNLGKQFVHRSGPTKHPS